MLILVSTTKGLSLTSVPTYIRCKASKDLNIDPQLLLHGLIYLNPLILVFSYRLVCRGVLCESKI